jgi:hypothetical protein
MTRPRDQRVVHLRYTQLFLNTGVAFPTCYVKHVMGILIELSKARLPSTGDVSAVTCKRCQRLYAAERRSA